MAAGTADAVAGNGVGSGGVGASFSTPNNFLTHAKKPLPAGAAGIGTGAAATGAGAGAAATGSTATGFGAAGGAGSGRMPLMTGSWRDFAFSLASRRRVMPTSASSSSIIV